MEEKISSKRMQEPVAESQCPSTAVGKLDVAMQPRFHTVAKRSMLRRNNATDQRTTHGSGFWLQFQHNNDNCESINLQGSRPPSLSCPCCSSRKIRILALRLFG